jgi:hypothetical protein
VPQISLDGQTREIEMGQAISDLYSDRREIVVAKINGVLSDLATQLNDGDVVLGVAISDPEGLVFCATPRRTFLRKRCNRLFQRPNSESVRQSRTASITTLT